MFLYHHHSTLYENKENEQKRDVVFPVRLYGGTRTCGASVSSLL